MPRRALQIEVLLDGELFIGRAVGPDRPLRVGPGRDCDIPTDALASSLILLEPSHEGYGLRLAPPLRGNIRTGGRTLHVSDGLLCDPRPEPLRLREGDAGVLALDERLKLRFRVVPALPGTFRSRLHLDPALTISTGGALAAAVLLIALMLRLPAGPAPGQEIRLQTRPALLDLRRARSTVRPERAVAAASASRGARARRAPLSPAQREASRRRGLLALLQPLPGWPGSRSGRLAVDPLAAMDRLLTASADTGVNRRSRDALGDWLSPVDGGLGLPAAEPPRRLLPRRDLLADLAARPPDAPAAPSREAIREVVVQGGPSIRLCYERELLTGAEPREGRLLLRWRIDGAGRAVALRVQRDSVRLPGLTECVLRQIRSWVFPACPSRCDVVYPFEFFARS